MCQAQVQLRLRLRLGAEVGVEGGVGVEVGVDVEVWIGGAGVVVGSLRWVVEDEVEGKHMSK